MTDSGWDRIEAAARGAFAGDGRFPIRAYSEFMPPPYVGIKPYGPVRGAHCTFGAGDPDSLDVDEYEQAHDLTPGLDHIADRVVGELTKLMRGDSHSLSHTLLADNPAWPIALAEAARSGRLAHDPVTIAMPIALSRTQDDKGNDRWTLFGASHTGAAAAFWRSFTAHGGDAAAHKVIDWLGGDANWRIIADGNELPAELRARRLADHDAIATVRTIVTFHPFSRLPAAAQVRYLAGTLRIIPSPASHVFFEHPGYRKLAHELPHATQIPLLHLFQRVEGSCAIRIPQSGWLDEHDPAQARTHGHKIVSHVARSHRWQRVARDAGVAAAPRDPVTGDGKYTDKVSVALFSTDPDVIGLYDKPLARNAQIWNAAYELVLDGPRADRAAIDRAAALVDAGGRFGYRQLFPPMRGGVHELFWHVPVIGKLDHHTGRARRMREHEGAPIGYVSAEHDGHALQLHPRLLARPTHVAAATQFGHEPGRARYTTSHNIRKLLEANELLGPLSPSYARALLHIAKHEPLEAWLAQLPAIASSKAAGEAVAYELRACLDAPDDPGAPRVIDQLGTRVFEEQIWRSIAGLAEGELRQKENADGVNVNAGKTGGPAAAAAKLALAERRDLEALGDHLHARYRDLIAAHGMTGRAEVLDHRFRWETDFVFPWSDGWAKNDDGRGHERNIVVMIPGANRGEAVIMGDHYDTAYMEDVYDADRGGDTLRAPAAGADDNHSATTALLLAAEQLLPLAAAGKLERDVWLVHLTGEEFPADSLGARAICQQLIEQRLAFTAEDGSTRDVSTVRVAGVYVLDMIGHNADRDRDVFQIAPGEGAASARLARIAHRANQRWNALATTWNQAPDRHGAGRAHRMPDGSSPPPPFSHLPLAGEVRVEWEPRSALYNTDGQVFSDVGVPVVLFMENYDISRTGYHDTLDTMANIDLDYCAALTAIAIESVVEAACAPTL
jgi:hypothetical protein